MAVRPVYVVKEKAPFFDVMNVEFEWNGGFAKVQKQKNIKAIHESFSRRMPGKKVLEISRKSMQEGGEALSAFFLPKYVPELGKSIPVECVFQAGKVFQSGGPYKDLMQVSPREAKRDERLKTSGRLTHFTFDGVNFPLNPKTIFYDYIYINALLENKDLAEYALSYDAFTDVEFNPERSVNCQAKAAATFVALSRMGLLEIVKDFKEFLSLYNLKIVESKVPLTNTSPEKEKTVEQPKASLPLFKVGGTLIHRMYGKGKIKSVSDTTLKIDFPTVGEKTLAISWCRTNCKVE